MEEWLLPGLFLIVGLGMLVAGIIYLRRERDDAESVRIYRVISIIGVVLIVISVVAKFLF